MKYVPRILFIAAVALYAAMAANAAALIFKQFSFDDAKALESWDKMTLNGRSSYELVRLGPDGYVDAVSKKACSALYNKVVYNLEEYPMLSWRWKVVAFPDISKAKTPKEKDDYAARVYVIFPYLSFTFSRFIEYIWAEDMPVGTVFDSPYGSNVKMIVVHRGMPDSDKWASESRNVYEDYVKAFGKPPDKNAGAVAMMCDADSTKTSAESMFDDITISASENIKEEGTEDVQA